jgi:hypothetical protein
VLNNILTDLFATTYTFKTIDLAFWFMAFFAAGVFFALRRQRD